MRATGRIHAAKLENCPRLQSVLRALREAGQAGMTTRQLIERTGYCAINSIVSELRENGQQIGGEWVKTNGGAEKAFLYRLDAVRPVQGDLFAK